MTKKGRISVALAMVLCLACSMTGCGKKNVSEDLQQLNNNQEDTESNAGTQSESEGQESDSKEETEKLNYTVKMDGGKNEYHVSAEIAVNEAGKAAHYEEQLLNLTEDKVTAYARNLFDGGNYQQVKPYAACDKEELNILKADLEKEKSEAASVYVEDEWYYQEKQQDVDFYLQHYIEPSKQYEEGKYYECQYYEAAKSGGELAGYLLYYSRIMILEGTIGGTPYQLVAYQADPEYGDYVNSYLKLYRVGETWSQHSWQPSTGHQAQSDSWGQENVCELTEEEAVNSAKNYMGMLGFEGMEVVETEYLMWQRTPVETSTPDSYEPQMVLDGYVFHMARSYEGISGLYVPVDWLWLSADGSSYAHQEEYVVNVDSKGVVSVESGPLYENTKAISESAELLPFEEIDKNAKAFFEEEIGRLGNEGENNPEGTVCQQPDRGNIYISSVKLAYASLQYEGKFQLVPVWVYYSTMNELDYPEAIINALNGELVKRNDNVFTCITSVE